MQGLLENRRPISKQMIRLLTILSFIFLVTNPVYASDSETWKKSQDNTTVVYDADADTDGDGLTDDMEINRHKSDPLVADTDGDGIDDGVEVEKHKSSPIHEDTDGDGLYDGDEIKKHRTNPTNADTDGDKVNDGAEIARGSDPRQSEDKDTPDTDMEEMNASDGVMTLGAE